MYVFRRSGSVWSQESYLKATFSAGGGEFGRALAIDGNVVVASSNFGANLFTRDGTVWRDEAYLVSPQSDNYAPFRAIGISGSLVVTGVPTIYDPGFNPGELCVFTQVGANWFPIQEAYLKASNTGAGDQYGTAVAISGDTIAVSAPLEDSNATGINGSQSNNSALSSGAVYIFVRSGYWVQQAYIKSSNSQLGDNFGSSIALDGDTLVVGASGEDSNATGINGNGANNSSSESGAALYLYQKFRVWTQQAYLKPANTECE